MIISNIQFMGTQVVCMPKSDGHRPKLSQRCIEAFLGMTSREVRIVTVFKLAFNESSNITMDVVN